MAKSTRAACFRPNFSSRLTFCMATSAQRWMDGATGWQRRTVSAGMGWKVGACGSHGANRSHGSPATTSLNSASVNACRVSVRMLPWAPMASSNEAATFTFGAWVIRTKS